MIGGLIGGVFAVILALLAAISIGGIVYNIFHRLNRIESIVTTNLEDIAEAYLAANNLKAVPLEEVRGRTYGLAPTSRPIQHSMPLSSRGGYEQ